MKVDFKEFKLDMATKDSRTFSIMLDLNENAEDFVVFTEDIEGHKEILKTFGMIHCVFANHIKNNIEIEEEKREVFAEYLKHNLALMNTTHKIVFGCGIEEDNIKIGDGKR